ncbi:hypothetical protein ACY2HL_004547 [Enterobacter roggenkampii]
MSAIKKKAEECIHTILRARNVPESQWSDLVKKTGRGMIQAGVVVVVTGVLVDNIPIPLKIAMQVCYLSLIGFGFLLNFNEKKTKGEASRTDQR